MMKNRWEAWGKTVFILHRLTGAFFLGAIAQGMGEGLSHAALADSAVSPPADPQVLSPIEPIEPLRSRRAAASLRSQFDAKEDLLDPFIPATRFRDVQPTDWAFQALQSIVERYDCLAGYPDGRYRGDRPLTRYEFAAALNACFDALQRFITAETADAIAPEDLITLAQLQEDFAAELSNLLRRTDTLEARIAFLEDHQFSTTVKLNGLSVIGLQGRTRNQADRFPRDGIQDTDDPVENFHLINLNYFILNTQFSPRTSLFMGLIETNGGAASRLTNDGRVAYDFFETPGLIVLDLNYRFLIGDKFAGFIGTEGINAINAFRGLNRVESAAFGPLSFFAQRNPILNIGFGRGGAGFDWQFAKRASLQGVYSTTIPGFFPNSLGGRGNNTAGVQLALTPVEPLDIALYYVNDYSPNGFLFSFAGDEQLTAPTPSTGQSPPLQTHAVGTTLTWQISPRFTLGGWAGYTHSSIPGQPGRVAAVNYMVFLNALDLFGEGNLGGLYIGQPPKIIHSNLPVGNNIPDFIDTGLGRSGGQPGTTFHFEAFYRWQLTNNISLTPGFMYILNPGHTSSSDPIAIGVLRTTFSF